MVEIFFNIYLKFFCFFNHPINTTLSNIYLYIYINMKSFCSFGELWSFIILHNGKVYTVKKSLRFLLVKMGNMKQLNMQKLFTECAKTVRLWVLIWPLLCFFRFFCFTFVFINCIILYFYTLYKISIIDINCKLH